MEDCTSWRDLPEDLQEQVLARLPLECVGRFCTVCKEWNALLSSTRFITTLWAQTPPNRNPWLLSVADDIGGEIVCERYSFITKTWENCFSFSFLREAASYVRIYWVTTAKGLCIVDLQLADSRRETFPKEDSFLCNPLTRTFLKLPNIPSQESIGIVGGEGDSYKIVAFSELDDAGYMKVSIYDPSQKKWKIAGQLPRTNGFLRDELEHRRMVFSESSVYCLMDIKLLGWGIVGFNIRDGISTVIPLPNLTNVTPHFFACGTRLLLVGYISIDDEVEVWDEDEFEDELEFEEEDEDEDVSVYEDDSEDDIGYEHERLVIWELQKNMARLSTSPPSLCWKEIARMPSSLCQKLRRRDIISEWPWFFECVGAGDCVVFFHFLGTFILSYNLSEQSWGYFKRHGYYCDIIEFEPRPDVKVE